MMFNRFLLFFFLLIAVARSSKFLIDWSKCNTDRVCYKVFQKGGSLDIWHYPPHSVVAWDKETLNSGVQIRYYSAHKWLVFIQHVGEELDATQGLVMLTKRGGEAAWGCKQNANKDVEYVAAASFTIVPYESYSRFEGNTNFCAFLINTDTRLFPTQPILEYTVKGGSTKTTIVGQQANLEGVVSQKSSCDPDFIKVNTNQFVEGFVKRPIPDISRNKLTCHEDHRLMITPPGKKPLQIESLDCVAKLYEYKPNSASTAFAVMKDAAGAPIEFEAFCAVPFSFACKDFTPPVPSIAFRRYPSKIFCPSNKWFINGNLYLVGQPFCDRSRVAPFDGGWFIRTRDKSVVEISKAQCYDKNMDCSIHSKLTYNCPLAKCEQFVQTKATVTCPATHILRLVQPSSGRVLQQPQLVCNGASGRWKAADMPEEAEDGASAYCEINCNVVSPLKEECPHNNNRNCTAILRNEQQIRCPVAHTLRIASTQSKSDLRLVCDVESGRWKTIDNVDVEKEAKVYCEADPHPAAPSVLLSLLPPLAVSVLVIVGVIAAIGALFVYQRKKNTQEAEEAIGARRAGGGMTSTMAPTESMDTVGQ